MSQTTDETTGTINCNTPERDEVPEIITSECSENIKKRHMEAKKTHGKNIKPSKAMRKLCF